jgi:hypothetical protein
MKTILMTLLVSFSSFVSARSADYSCEVRRYEVDITITGDTSTSMWFRDYSRVLAMGYAGSVEKSGIKTIYHFYPQLGPIDMTFKTQDMLDFPEKLTGRIHVNAPFFVVWDDMSCTRRD